jgi:hypothetical protein
MGFERYPNLAEFNQELIIKYSKKNCFDKFNVGNCDECLWALKDTLDGVLIGDSFNQTAAFLDVLARR